VGSLCEKVGIANAAEHTQMLIQGCDAVESDIRAGDADRLTREVIQ
jgi:hypothetical protein